jgi:hypothetical protein
VWLCFLGLGLDFGLMLDLPRALFSWLDINNLPAGCLLPSWRPHQLLAIIPDSSACPFFSGFFENYRPVHNEFIYVRKQFPTTSVWKLVYVY